MSERKTGAQGAKELPLFSLRVLTAIFTSSLFWSSLSAQVNPLASGRGHESEHAAQARALNNAVLQLHGQVQENASSVVTARGQAATVLAQRSGALLTLIRQEPHAALSLSFSSELLADLAAKFPNSTAALESHIAVTGPVEHWVMDSTDLKTAQESWVMNAGG